MFIDTHVHLDLLSRDSSQIEQIINQSKKEQINILFNISVDYKSNLISQDLANKYAGIFFSGGLHPSEAENYNIEQIAHIEKIILNNKCIGIGEVGIDLYRNYSTINNQRNLFEIFLNMAKKYNKPVIIHSRNAFKDIYKLICKNEYQNIKGVFHCFSYGYEEAKKCADKGFMISFAGNLTFNNAYKLQETAKKLPLEYIIAETDSPFLTPEPIRGRKNCPSNLIYILNFLSNIRNLSMIDLMDKINNNIQTIFKRKFY